jgi:ligand-binding SRPBCC domain-containing protein
MHVYEHRFVVNAPLAAVSAFHSSTLALRKLTPPPVFVQFHHIDPLGEGSISAFTLWFGPLPIPWTSQHSDVDPLRGFTDTMIRGPFARSFHRHGFEAIDATHTAVTDHLEYEYRPGLRGWLGWLLYSPLSLPILFAYRAWATKRGAERKPR